MTDKKLKILIITRYFPPYNSIASLRPYSWAKYWARAGHEVHVLTYPEESNDNPALSYDLSAFTLHFARNSLLELLNTVANLKAGKRNAHTSENKSGGICFFLKNCVDRLARRLHDCRIPNVHDFWYYKALSQVQNTFWDVVVSTYAPPVTHLVARTLKRKGLARVWCADFRDLWIDHSIAKGFPPFTYCENYLEKSVCTEADLVTVISQPQVDILVDKYKNINVKVIFNGFDVDDSNSITDSKFFDDEKVTLLYTGTIYKDKRDPEPLFEAVNAIRYNLTHCKLIDKLQIVFAGGSFLDLNGLINKYQLENTVKYIGYVDRITSLHMQRDANVLIFLENDNDCVKGVLTGKIFEYLYSGTEIWGLGITDKSLPGNLIVSSGAGRNFGNNVESIKNALIALLSHKTKKHIEIDEKVMNLFSRENMANEMLGLLTQLRALDSSWNEET